MMQTILEGASKRNAVQECCALVREVDEGTNTTADPELVALSRRVGEADRRKAKPVQEALAAISRVRRNGGDQSDQDTAAEPFMEELQTIESEIDSLIVELADFAPSAGTPE